MRILCISAQKPDSTGSGVYLAETVGALLALGHRVSVIAGVDAADAPSLPAGTCFCPVRFNTPELPFDVCGMSDVMPYDATRYRDMTAGMVGAFSSAFEASILGELAAFRPDLIICHHLYLVCAVACETIARAAADPRFSGTLPRVVAICHNTDLRQMRSHSLERERIIAGVRSLDAVLALHAGQIPEICSVYGVPRNRVHIVGTGFDAGRFHPMPGVAPMDDISSGDGCVELCYAGKIARAKGVHSLLRCLGPLSGGSHGFRHMRLRLVGGHGSRAEYDEAVRLARRAPEGVGVEFLGRVSQEELAGVYTSSDVFVLPSFSEGLPLVVIEALACGCAVVVTDLPGIRPWIRRELPDAPVFFVAPPALGGVDEPVEANLPEFERRLADAIHRAAYEIRGRRAAGYAAADCSHLTWSALAGRILRESCGNQSGNDAPCAG